MPKVVSAKSETVRIFKSNFLEFFTRVHWSVPLLLYVPLVAFCLFRALNDPIGGWGALSLSLILGLVGWSLMEYLLHRYFFHFKPKSPRLQKVLYLVHEFHHEYPNDPLRLVMPPIESIPLAIVFYFGLSKLIPNPYFFPFFAGLTLGYLAYDMIHYASHHLAMKGKVGQFLKRYHLQHHFQSEKKGYGVSSPLWDYLFRTAL